MEVLNLVVRLLMHAPKVKISNFEKGPPCQKSDRLKVYFWSLERIYLYIIIIQGTVIPCFINYRSDGTLPGHTKSYFSKYDIFTIHIMLSQ